MYTILPPFLRKLQSDTVPIHFRELGSFMILEILLIAVPFFFLHEFLGMWLRIKSSQPYMNLLAIECSK